MAAELQGSSSVSLTILHMPLIHAKLAWTTGHDVLLLQLALHVGLLLLSQARRTVRFQQARHVTALLLLTQMLQQCLSAGVGIFGLCAFHHM